MTQLRQLSAAELSKMDYKVTDSQYSVNLAVQPPGHQDGWLYYRRLLAEVGVAVFPGILTMSLSDPLFRMTIARSEDEIAEGLRRMKRLAS